MPSILEARFCTIAVQNEAHTIRQQIQASVGETKREALSNARIQVFRPCSLDKAGWQDYVETFEPRLPPHSNFDVDPHAPLQPRGAKLSTIYGPTSTDIRSLM
eukprot:4350130-Pyramimonas_sp.AAC.2